MATKRKHPDAPVSFRLSPEMKKWAQKWAANQERDLSWVMRRALLQYRELCDPESLEPKTPAEAARKGGV